MHRRARARVLALALVALVALVAVVLSLACGRRRGILEGHAGADDPRPSKSSTAPPSSASGIASCPSHVWRDRLEPQRRSCVFDAGARVADTLGFSAADRKRIPISHVVVITQENRSFDHYFGRLAKRGHPAAEGWPDGFTNPDGAGTPVAPFHAPKTCMIDNPPHQWKNMHTQWNEGKMDGFVRSAREPGTDGRYVLGYYDEGDIPFYYWLAKTFAIADHHFASVMSGTWPNREYLYAATSRGVKNSDARRPKFEHTLFDALDEAKVAWGVYTGDGANTSPRQYCIGWERGHRGVSSYSALLAQLRDGTLPAVSFVDPRAHPDEDEHPPYDIQRGEAWSRAIFAAAFESPLWPRLAIIHTYDEAGGTFDHVPPPPACPPSADQKEFDRLGFRVPLIVVSPWARPGFVSHAVHEHTSITRFIELLHDLPALTARDANADALLDLFDFQCDALAHPSAPPASGVGGCRLSGG